MMNFTRFHYIITNVNTKMLCKTLIYFTLLFVICFHLNKNYELLTKPFLQSICNFVMKSFVFTLIYSNKQIVCIS